jgi:hypothetical protein
MGLADISFAKKHRYHNGKHYYYSKYRHHQGYRDGVVGHTVRSTERFGADTLRSTGDFLKRL